MNKKLLIVPLIFILFLVPMLSNADWFDKGYNKDVQYSRIDELTGVVETTDTIKINETMPVYLKVLGADSDPWMIANSGWYLDLYLRPDLQSGWTIVKSNVHNSYPSDEITVQAGVTAEMRAVLYYPVVIETTLTEDLLPEATVMICNDTSAFASAGVVEVENEYMEYGGKTGNNFSSLSRGGMESEVDYHPAGTKVKFFSGKFYIPIIIAIDISNGGGSGGAMHPSRCHALDFRISRSTTPYAVFKCMVQYCTVKVDASKSYDPDGEIVSYQWDWNEDGVYDATGVTTEHDYLTEGGHRVTLKVTDNDGISAKWNVDVTTHFPPYNSNILSYTFLGIAVWLWILIGIIVIAVFLILRAI